MAHFAELDKNNKVLRVIVIDNNLILNEEGVEQESLGIDYCKSLFGNDTKWIQTSYNQNFRKKYAGINDIYDTQEDAFMSVSPFQSWKFNKNTWDWEAPISMPNNGKRYIWDEKTISWVEKEPLIIE